LLTLFAVLIGPAQAAPAADVSPDSTATAALPRGPLHPAGRWIKDATGRTVVIHGLQLARKTPPYAAPAGSFTAQDAQNIQDWGFDAVRLGWFWKGAEPQRGRMDRGYLAEIAREGTLLADHHVFTLLEAHQDGYNEKLGGAGFPDWATITDGTWEPVQMVPGTGVFDLQAARAFDNLYANTDGIADAFAHAWAAMAAGFRHNPMMLGYDLFNEPNPGSQWATCANPLGCPAFDLTTLEPVEDKLAAAVRSVDPTTMAFYEPNIYFDSGVASWLRAPDSTSGPSGFAFHDYCLSAALTGQPDHESQASGYPACPTIDNGVFANALRAAATMGVPPLFDEFGDTQDLSHIERVIALADSNLTGWVYWSYKDWVDAPGGLGSGPLFDDSDHNGTLRRAKLAVLSQPYPMATAGLPLDERYDPATNTFDYTYAPDRSISSPTVIFASPLHYPRGYTVAVTGARVVSARGARYLELQPDRSGDRVQVRLMPAPGTRAARTTPAAHTSGACDAKCSSPSSPRHAPAAITAAPASIDGDVLGTASGSCNANADRPAVVSSASPAATQSDVIAQVRTDGGAGEVTAPNGISVAYGAGDTAWVDLGPVSSGASARAAVICRSGPATYTFTFLNPPTLPTRFSGSSTHDISVSLASSRLAFQVPATGHYVADVAVTQGTIEVGLRRHDGSTPAASTFGTGGTEDLGTLPPGAASLDVIGLPGAQAHWTISIHAAGATGRART
jgi:endoglycosylceramidase